MTTVWFYRFPDEMPRYIPLFCRNEQEARANVRTILKIKRIPQGSKFWVEEIDEFRDIRGSEADKLDKLLTTMECPHKISGKNELTIHLGPIEMSFDREGRFTRLIWYDTGGPSGFNDINRGEGSP